MTPSDEKEHRATQPSSRWKRLLNRPSSLKVFSLCIMKLGAIDAMANVDMEKDRVCKQRVSFRCLGRSDSNEICKNQFPNFFLLNQLKFILTLVTIKQKFVKASLTIKSKKDKFERTHIARFKSRTGPMP